MTINSVQDVDLFDGDGIRRVTYQAFEGSPGNVLALPQSTPDIYVDGTGCTLLPGFIDAKIDADACSSALPLFAAYGCTTVIDSSSASAENQAMRGASRDPTLPSYLASGCVIGPDKSSFRDMFPFRAIRPVRTPRQAQHLVDELVAAPVHADYIKIIADQPGLDFETLNAAVAAAHSHGKLAIAHASQTKAYDAVLRAGVDIVTAVPIDGPLDKATVQGFAKQKIGVVPTLCFLQKSLREQANRGLDFNYAIEAVRQLHRAGVRICAGTAANEEKGLEIPFGISLHEEMHLLSKAGLSNLDVLRSATCIPANVFKLHDRGIIEPGKRADLVLVEGNPLSDLTATRRIRRVWVEGVEVNTARDI